MNKGETIVQVHGAGPFKVNWVNPSEVLPPDAPAAAAQNRRLASSSNRAENFVWKIRRAPRSRFRLGAAYSSAMLDSNLQRRDNARLPERGTSGSVQRGPANPARPGREQRYRDCLGCRRSPEVPLMGKFAGGRTVGGEERRSEEVSSCFWLESLADIYLGIALRSWFLFFGSRNRTGVPSSLTPNELPGHSPQVAPANIQRSRRTTARHVNAGQRDQERSRGACVHFFRRARRGKNDGGANSGEGHELREGADRRALRRMRFLQGDCRGNFAGRD